MKEVLALPDGFKRRYTLSAFAEMTKGHARHFDMGGGAGEHPLRMPKLAG